MKNVPCFQVCGTPGQFVGVEAFVTGDGKGMLHSHFSEGERCWLCDGSSDHWLTRLHPIDTFPNGPNPKYMKSKHTPVQVMYFAMDMGLIFGAFRSRTGLGITCMRTVAQAFPPCF